MYMEIHCRELGDSAIIKNDDMHNNVYIKCQTMEKVMILDMD